MEIVNFDFNATINTRRCVVLKTTAEDMRPSMFVGKPLRCEVCQEKLKTAAGGQSKKAGRRLRGSIFLYTLWIYSFFVSLNTRVLLLLMDRTLNITRDAVLRYGFG
jgi:hypothetical protein